MAKILYCVSPIGLGHATRAVAVGQELAKKGHELVFATGRYAAEFLEGEGFRVEDAIVEPIPKVRGGEMKNVAKWYFDYWRGYHRSRTALSRLLDQHRPGLVVGDEEFACLSLALERGLRHAMISDELELGFARGWLAGKLEKRVGRWYKDLQRRVSLIIMPEEGEDSGNIRHVGPVVRARTKSRAQVFGELALSGSDKLVLVSMSGSDVGDELLHRAIDAFQEAKIPLAQLLVSGNRGPRVSGDCIRDLGMVRDNQNLVAASDLVVTNGGRSAIDEALSAGTPVISIPIRNHAEQERNASALGYGPDDIDRLRDLMLKKIGKRHSPTPSDGARRTAEILESLVQGRPC